MIAYSPYPTLPRDALAPRGMAGAGVEGARAFLPGDVGAKVIGHWADVAGKYVALGMNWIWPGSGAVLTEVMDGLAAYVLKPANDYLDAAIKGIVAFMPAEQANKVLAKMSADQQGMFLDAVKDAVAALVARVDGVGPGRSKSVAVALGVGFGLFAKDFNLQVQNRLAGRVYLWGLQAGCKEYEAGAAAGYALLHLQAQGLPGKITGQGNDGGRQYVAGGQVDQYLVKLAAADGKIERSPKWIEARFAALSGQNRKAGGGGAGVAIVVGLLAVAAAMRG